MPPPPRGHRIQAITDAENMFGVAGPRVPGSPPLPMRPFAAPTAPPGCNADRALALPAGVFLLVGMR